VAVTAALEDAGMLAATVDDAPAVAGAETLIAGVVADAAGAVGLIAATKVAASKAICTRVLLKERWRCARRVGVAAGGRRLRLFYAGDVGGGSPFTASTTTIVTLMLALMRERYEYILSRM
jgi:hypothetical protein